MEDMAKKLTDEEILSLAAAINGRKGGSKKSEKKSLASRANGAKRSRKPDNELSPSGLKARRRRERLRAEKGED